MGGLKTITIVSGVTTTQTTGSPAPPTTTPSPSLPPIYYPTICTMMTTHLTPKIVTSTTTTHSYQPLKLTTIFRTGPSTTTIECVYREQNGKNWIIARF